MGVRAACKLAVASPWAFEKNVITVFAVDKILFVYFGICRAYLSSTSDGPFLIIFCVCIVPYDIVCVPVGEVGWTDPQGGPDGHGRSHSQPMLGGGGQELLSLRQRDGDFGVFRRRPDSAPAEVSTWFTRQHHFVYNSNRQEGSGK